jgi:protein-S-isoprenylcysteine O-methyltransferase Ste14
VVVADGSLRATLLNGNSVGRISDEQRLQAVPAMLDFPQAQRNVMLQETLNWIWVVLFVVATVVRKAHERKAGRHSSLRGTPIVEGALMVLWGVAAGVLPLLYIGGSWLDFANYPFILPPAFGYFGIFLFLIAIWLLHRSHADLGRLWSPTVEPAAKQRLVTDGVYSRIRHPMYAAHVLWGGAQALLLPNFMAGPLALIVLIVIIGLRVPREEQAMLDEFGEVYGNYMKTTGRILPLFNL